MDEASWIALDPAPGETLRAALRRALRDAIRAGALRDGVRLPASRALAQRLGVSRGVVSDAYAQLQAEGFLVTKERSAPVVAAGVRSQPAPRMPETPTPAPRYDLTPTTPDVTVFPLGRWLAAYQSAARRRSTPVSLGVNPLCARCLPTISVGRAGSSPTPHRSSWCKAPRKASICC